MRRASAVTSIFLALAVSACQTVAPVAAPPSLMATDAGYVIGTASYAFSEREPDHALIKFSRVAPGEAIQTYLLGARYDSRARLAIFTGMLPAGVYVVEEAISDDARYAPGTLRMPFEVLPGQVTDTGHHPLQQRAAIVHASLAR